jgi:hypothetical protein
MCGHLFFDLSKIKFNVDLFSDSRVAAYGETNMVQLMVVLYTFLCEHGEQRNIFLKCVPHPIVRMHLAVKFAGVWALFVT